jgi:CPA1 family monovalent cation:H+ antiporter
LGAEAFVLGDIHSIEIVLLLLLFFVVVFGALAKKLHTPYPIVLVIGGLLLSFIPGIPRITLNPDIVFLVVLPPLLYNAAWLTSWREFSYNLVSILFLAFGLVTFTVVGVSLGVHWFLPGLDWRMGLVLGAVVAPTDAIAAVSIASRIGLPKRIVEILEGESLLNDATALLALEFGIGLLVGGQRPTVMLGILRLAYLIVVGVLTGLVIGEIVHQIEHRIEDAPIEIALSLLTPYAAYLSAEQMHASGVLAVVVCGLYLTRKSSHFFTPSVRVQAWAVWESMTFVLNGRVFVMIGLQLPYVLKTISDHDLRTLTLYAAIFCAGLIVLRLIWVFPGAHLAYLIRRHVLHQKEATPTAKGLFVLGWTGMRGVISLAAAISVPRMLANGEPFVQRNVIIFLTFAVILVTLVLQGLTLPSVIRGLGLAGLSISNQEEVSARRLMAEAALLHLEQVKSRADSTDEGFDDIERHYRRRLATLDHEEAHAEPGDADFYKKYAALSRELLNVERKTAVELRNQSQIGDELLRELEHELDLGELKFQRRRAE